MRDQDFDALAGEYVLGTLDAAERAEVAARRLREPALDAAISAWEERLAPLIAEVRPIAPPSTVLAAVEARIDGRAGAAVPSNIVQLEARLARWRRIAVATSSIAAALLVTFGLREATRPASPTNYVAVMQQDDASPAFVLSVDLVTKQVTIRPVTMQPRPNSSYELWVVTDQKKSPRSLGLVGDGFTTRRFPVGYSTEELEGLTFGLSVEPPGGSPTGSPTGPVLFHAKLIKARE